MRFYYDLSTLLIAVHCSTLLVSCYSYV